MRQMAIIQGVGVGLRDTNQPILWWSVHTGNNGSALLIFDWATAADIIRDYDVREIHSLNGKPCWVEVSNNTIVYKGACITQREEA